MAPIIPEGANPGGQGATGKISEPESQQNPAAIRRADPRFPTVLFLTSVTLHLTQFEGNNALSNFRALQLLPRLQAIHRQVSAIQARFIHVVSSDAALDETLKSQLAQLLTYGEPYRTAAGSDTAVRILVTPRLGTVSPWASKASDIAHNCALPVRRIERLVEYELSVKQPVFGKNQLSKPQLDAVAALLHDRMTESVLFDRSQAAGLFTDLAMLTFSRAAARHWRRPTASLALRWRPTRWTTWSRRSPSSNATRPMWS
jgi:hypothetical protein